MDSRSYASQALQFASAQRAWDAMHDPSQEFDAVHDCKWYCPDEATGGCPNCKPEEYRRARK